MFNTSKCTNTFAGSFWFQPCQKSCLIKVIVSVCDFFYRILVKLSNLVSPSFNATICYRENLKFNAPDYEIPSKFVCNWRTNEQLIFSTKFEKRTKVWIISIQQKYIICKYFEYRELVHYLFHWAEDKLDINKFQRPFPKWARKFSTLSSELIYSTKNLNAAKIILISWYFLN